MFAKRSERLKDRLAAIAAGRSDAAHYQHVVLEILNYLFNPELIDGQPEVSTIDGTERRDIIFTNDSDENFWDYVRKEYGILLMCETKNTEELDTDAINQTATLPRSPNWALGSNQNRKASEGFDCKEDNVCL